MARSSKVEECILCESIPCVCGKAAPKPKKPAAPRKAKAEPAIKAAPVVKTEEIDLATPSSKVNAFAAMKAAAKPIDRQVPDSVASSAGPAGSAISSADEKAVFDQAVRVLAPILHPVERAKYRDVIESEPTIEERRRAWRTRRVLPTSAS